jgi:hypothetical protein
VSGRDEAQALALFQERYRNTPSPLTRQIEQRVIGADWGANGFTTMDQADTLTRELHLSAADRLLDLGSGRGWPGLYLAARTGCRVVLTDLPLEGLRVAANRAASEGLLAQDGRGGRGGQWAAVSSRQLRCHHPHRRAVLTAGQALRAESLQTGPATRRTYRLLHHP